MVLPLLLTLKRRRGSPDPRRPGTDRTAGGVRAAPRSRGLALLGALALSILPALTALTAVPTPSSAAGASLSASPGSVAPGGSVTASWSGVADPTGRDWIGLYATAGAANEAYVDWKYVGCGRTPGAARASGSCTFTMPATPGTAYQFRLFANDGYARLAAAAVTVTGGGPAATATPVPTATAGPPAVQPPLLARYENLTPLGNDYNQTFYRPRQFVNGVSWNDATWGRYTITNTTATYAGWDLLITPNQGPHRERDTAAWFKLTLNRPARLALLWQDVGAVPSWVTSSWTVGPPVTWSDGTTSRTYHKDFPAGDVSLGSLRAPGAGGPPAGNTYLVLLAEAGGVASVAPTVPVGKETPTANQTCPAWVHDQYTTVVDGVVYPTWHPQIDPVYYCYFRHEHGSDPKLFGDGTWKPAYGRSALASGIPENHEGFKGARFLLGDHDFYYYTHMGTANVVGAACQHLHEVAVAQARLSDRVLTADVMFMADFGRAVENTTHTPLNPPGCPNQGTLRTGSGMRLFPVQNGTQPTVFYYPWNFDHSGTVVGLGSRIGINNPDLQTICLDMQCSANVSNAPAPGAKRFFNPAPGFGVRATLAAATGVFYTDPLGKVVRPGPGAGNVRQFVHPSANASTQSLTDQGACVTGPGYKNLFQAEFMCVTDAQAGEGNSTELEASLGGAGRPN